MRKSEKTSQTISNIPARKTTRRTAPPKESLGDIYLRIVRVENPGMLFGEIAKIMDISITTQNNLLYGNPSQHSVGKLEIVSKLENHFPQGWAIHGSEFLEKIGQLSSGVKARPPSPSDEWKSLCANFAVQADNLIQVKQKITKIHILNIWDRIAAGDTNLTISQCNKTLNEIVATCNTVIEIDPEMTESAEQIRQIAEGLLKMAPKMV